MKYITRLFSLLILVSATIFYSSCGGKGGDKSQEELQLDKLKFAWTLQSANDGTDRTDEYPDMVLTISGTFSEGGTYSYSSTASSWPSISPWKANDTWKFVPGSIANGIVRQSDLQEMTYTLSNSDKTLTISFNYQGPGFNNGRVSSVEGSWDFIFTRP